MSYKRRQFLLASLGYLGFASLSAILKRFRAKPAVANEPAARSLEPIAPELIPPDIQASAQDLLPTDNEVLLRFSSLGDTGTGTRSQYAVAAAMIAHHQKQPFPLVLMAGDNIYNNGEMSKIAAVFERPYQPLLQRGVKFHACLGNHDIRTENGTPQVRYPGFNMQGRYYSVRQGPVQFFALDTNTNAPWRDQLSWLDQELSRSDALWKVVFGHHTLYSSGPHGTDRTRIRLLVPLFQKHNVQLYINGHDHHYERSREINGTTYVICGAGAGTRPVGRSSWTAYSASRLSFVSYTVYRDRMELQAIGTNHQVFDRGLIRR